LDIKVTTPISRREFLLGFIPSWWSKDVALGIAIGLAIVAASAIAVSVLKDVGFLGLTRALLIAIGFMVVVWLIRKLVRLSKKVFEHSPPVLKAFFTVSLQFILYVTACVVGARVYERWQRVEERPEMLFTLALFFILSVIGEWGKRRSNQSPQTTPVSAPR
jgi:hypothetical protein